MPIIMPISDLVPPWLDIKKGKRKNIPKLDTVNRFTKDMAINNGL